MSTYDEDKNSNDAKVINIDLAFAENVQAQEYITELTVITE